MYPSKKTLFFSSFFILPSAWWSAVVAVAVVLAVVSVFRSSIIRKKNLAPSRVLSGLSHLPEGEGWHLGMIKRQQRQRGTERGGGLGGSRGARKRLVSTSTSVWMFAPLVEVEEKGVGLAWRWSELGVQWGVF